MKILLIEDEKSLAQSICEYLQNNDILCEQANQYHEAIDKLAVYQYDCVLLDLSLPGGSGFEILNFLKKEKREEGIIIISAKNTLDTRIKGLELGADDFLVKPFHLSELLARIHALIRRKKFYGNNKMTINEIEIDLTAKEVYVNNKILELTKTEYDLLMFLIANKNKVLSKSSIAEHLSGDMADMLDNYDFVYAHVKNLKKKIQQAGGSNYIHTIYGVGYKFQE